MELPQNSFQISTEIKTNMRKLFECFHSSDDIRTREFRLQGVQGAILYLNAATNRDKLQSDVLRPLLESKEGLLEDILPILDIEIATDLEMAAAGMLQGKCAILLDQRTDIILADVAANMERSITESQNEQVIRGSHDGFIDDADVNMQMIHKRLKNPNLVERDFTLGAQSPTGVKLLYMSELADLHVVNEVIARLLTNEDVFIKSPGQILNRLESSWWSPFPQMLYTERPDTTVSHLMEGRVILLVDGSSFAVVLPVTFFMFFQIADDFNVRWWNGTFFRFLRFISVMIGLALPSVYISIVSNHFEVLPIDLLFSLKASLENIPFNPLIEALFMITVLELLREAAIRLPKSIASTLSIVGGLVIGSEVVNAGLVSTTMIVVISLTAVASFSLPSHEMRLAVRLVSFPIMIASLLLGFAGIAFSFSLLFMHLSKLETYGVPYFYPFTPFQPRRILTTLVQLPKRIFRRKASDRRVS
ncbi:spore germination protein [Paenibacillus sp. CGMCC 1.16610]|uniref:Spore germination protein n=1 Tax=Paenibacillus anseongense TaxID=2682845 RepID=A0ABW9U6N2_9BACL|nr:MULTISPECIES: spore germination protein [Paenibacillus]MBA2942968.1 spore germination protein [Paenibacillus sp. CGMCC 1.16610]MVQ33465.1 spore germination protein [Paenibacillus anseongense]